MSFSRDYFEGSLMLESASGDLHGQGVLGKVKGQFFVPDGTSRNKRFYSRSLWEKQLKSSELQKRIKDRRMFGTISHEQPIDDKALLEGKISHIVTNLWIDEQGRGMGEALILDTDAGRILNTVLRAGGKLFVSSRATGRFQGERNGVPMVDEGTYSLSTFDYVLDPGFLEANPSIAESIDKIFIQENTEEQGEDNMVNEKLIRENQDLTRDVKSLSEAKQAVDQRVATLEAELKEANDKAAAAAVAEAELAKYKDLGSVEEVSKAIETFAAKAEALEKSNLALTESNAKYVELGTPAELETVLEKAIEAQEELKEFHALGTVEELSAVLDHMEAGISAKDEEAKTSATEALAKKLGVDVSVIEKLQGKMTEEEITSFVAGIKNVSNWSETSKEPVKEAAPAKETKTSAMMSEGNKSKRLMNSLLKP